MPVITVCFLMLGVQVLLMLVLGLLQRFVQGATLRTIAQVVLGLTVAVPGHRCAHRGGLAPGDASERERDGPALR